MVRCATQDFSSAAALLTISHLVWTLPYAAILWVFDMVSAAFIIMDWAFPNNLNGIFLVNSNTLEELLNQNTKTSCDCEQLPVTGYLNCWTSAEGADTHFELSRSFFKTVVPHGKLDHKRCVTFREASRHSCCDDGWTSWPYPYGLSWHLQS